LFKEEFNELLNNEMEDSDLDDANRDSIMVQRALNCNKKEDCGDLIKVLSVGISK